MDKKPAKQVQAYSLGREPQDHYRTESKAHEVGGSAMAQIAYLFAAIMLSLAFASFACSLALTWGLRPRLYACACFAG